MPVLGIGDQGLCCQRPLELAVDRRHDLLALADVEAALGIGEVVLHVHDDQRRRSVVVNHCTALLGGCRPHHAPARTRSVRGDLLVSSTTCRSGLTIWLCGTVKLVTCRRHHLAPGGRCLEVPEEDRQHAGWNRQVVRPPTRATASSSLSPVTTCSSTSAPSKKVAPSKKAK